MSNAGTDYLDRLIEQKKAPSEFDAEGKQRTQADLLIEIGRSNHVLFHDGAGGAYAEVGKAVYSINSSQYREVLTGEYLNITDRGCNRNALTDAIGTLKSLAIFRGERRDVWLRVGGTLDRVMIDTGDADHSIIEVTASGWRVIESNRAMFRRVPSMLPLPVPASPDFPRIWKYLTVAEEARPLVAGFLLSAFSPVGPYPVLIPSGEQGTGKSTHTKALKKLADPSTSPLRSPPKELRDLLVGAINCRLLAIDNISSINPQLSDAFCRIATGGAISERALYSNTDEVLIEVQRPMIINGIEDPANRPDLAERSIHIELEQIDTRRTEAEFWSAFDKDAPHIFGAILEGLVCSVKNYKTIEIGKLPRMADFARWAAAGMEPLGFTADEFMIAYRTNIQDGQSSSVDSSPVGEAIVKLMASRNQWEGTPSELLLILTRFADDAMTRNPAWPKNARWMTGSVTRISPALRAKGISVDRKRTENARLIILCNVQKIASCSSAASFADGNDGNDGNDDRTGPCFACDGEGCRFCEEVQP